MILKAQNIWGQ